ncbi:RNase H domain-containing protein [Trichonephila clavipes]|nr:RNase H domain-containing protein [Trichonephila clavipes]
MAASSLLPTDLGLEDNVEVPPPIRCLTGYHGNRAMMSITELGQRKQVCLQWIPSHVGVPGNEAADELAGRGCDLSNPSSIVFSHSTIHSLQRTKMNLTWRNPPARHWYAVMSPGLSLQFQGLSDGLGGL